MDTCSTPEASFNDDEAVLKTTRRSGRGSSETTSTCVFSGGSADASVGV